jgi:hypothetical protein
VPDARFPSTLPALNGSALTSLTAANVAGSHTLPDGVLSTNVPLLSAANAFTANQTVTGTVAPSLTLNSLSNNYALIKGSSGTIQAFMQARDADTAVAVGALSNHPLQLWAGGAAQATISTAGVVSTNNTSAGEIGTKGRVHRDVSATGNTAASDAGGSIVLTGSTSGQTFTCDSDPPNDSVLRIVNVSSQNWTIAGSGSMNANGATGSLTLVPNAALELFHRSGGNWYAIT